MEKEETLDSHYHSPIKIQNTQNLAVTEHVLQSWSDLTAPERKHWTAVARRSPEKLCNAFSLMYNASVKGHKHNADAASIPSSVAKDCWGPNYKNILEMYGCSITSDFYFYSDKTGGTCKQRSRPLPSVLDRYRQLIEAHEAAGKINYSTPSSYNPIRGMMDTHTISDSCYNKVMESNELTLNDKLYFRLMLTEDRTIRTQYWKHSCGRKYAIGASLQGAPNRLRDLILEGTGACDTDQHAACPTIAVNMLVLDGVLSPSDAQKFIALPKSVISHSGESPLRTAACFMKKFDYQTEAAFPVLKEFRKAVHSYMTYRQPGIKKGELRTAWANAVFTKESACQELAENMLTRLGYRRISHIFDGCILDREPTVEHMDAVNAYVRRETNIEKFELRVKKVWK